MKKLITICLVMISLAFTGMAAQKAYSSKTKGKRHKTTSSRVIGHFKAKFDDLTVYLHSNGKVTTSKKCYRGGFKKKDGGKYYTLYYSSGGGGDCGEGELVYLITGNEVYYIDGGSENVINDFTYNPDKRCIKVNLDPTYQTEREWLQENAYRGFTSLEIPLSKFDREGTITWTK